VDADLGVVGGDMLLRGQVQRARRAQRVELEGEEGGEE
jgi:hypothetical protein